MSDKNNKAKTNSKTTEAIWFTQYGGKQIGIVVKDGKAYIGNGQGFDEERDKQSILKMGAKLHKHTLERILELMKEKE